MEAVGETISFVTSEEENDLHGIEKALGKPIPRVTLPDFDYKAPPRRRCGGTRVHAVRGILAAGAGDNDGAEDRRAGENQANARRG